MPNGPLTDGDGRPLVFGEVLFDVFEDGHAVLGGAPFNVAWHLRSFGENPLFVSRVGDDLAGEKVLSTMRRRGLDTAGVQIDSVKPTGSVRVKFHHGEPRYDIMPDQAYDHIDAAVALSTCEGRDLSLLHHGTLAARSDCSRRALESLRKQLGLSVFIDPNLRSPWWELDRTIGSLKMAKWAKVNAEEILILSGHTPYSDVPEAELASRLRAECDLSALIVTSGARGALVATPSGTLKAEAYPTDSIIDTVGAGDAFDAVIILGLLRGWSFPLILGRAAQFAADVCGIQGATTTDRDFYEVLLREWGEHEAS